MDLASILIGNPLPLITQGTEGERQQRDHAQRRTQKMTQQPTCTEMQLRSRLLDPPKHDQDQPDRCNNRNLAKCMWSLRLDIDEINGF